MPVFDLTRATTVGTNRRRNLLLAVSLLATGALVVAVVTNGDGSAEGSQLGPTLVADRRDLATTLEAPGTLQRSSEHTVAYAGAMVPSGGEGEAPTGETPAGDGGDGADSPDSADGSDDPETSSFAGTNTTSSSSTTPSSSTSSSSSSPTSSTPTSSTSTTDPCSPGSTSPGSTSSSTSSSTPCPTTPPSTDPPPPSTSPTTSPTTPPADGNGGDGSSGQDGERGPTDDGAAPPRGGDDGGPQSGPRGDGGLSSGPSAITPSSASPDGDDGEVPSAVLTSLLDVGTTADRGTVLYTADDQPVVSLIGELPAWRTLQEGVGDGADVQQLEENLVALGYDAGAVDQSFTSETAAAVEAWETDLGRATPDGVVTIGDVVFLTAPGDVLGHEAAAGDTLQPGSPVLTVGSEQRIVVADVDVTESGGWAPGSTVELQWDDGTTTEGTVFGVGREVTSGQVEMIVAVGAGDPGAGERLSGATAEVRQEDARRDGVVAVPVAAIVEHDGSPAVRVAQDGGPDQVVPVETGLVTDGWIEITAGLDDGDEVRLPG